MNKLAILRKKLKNKKGFTLMEMLIVVAIIVILLAIAIPSFNSALTKSKVAADEANVRAWYAECMLEEMTDSDDSYSLPAPASGSYSASDFPGGSLQADGATVAVTGTTAETFKVTYTATGDYEMIFGNNS